MSYLKIRIERLSDGEPVIGITVYDNHGTIWSTDLYGYVYTNIAEVGYRITAVDGNTKAEHTVTENDINLGNVTIAIDLQNPKCKDNKDCKDGYECINGECVPKTTYRWCCCPAIGSNNEFSASLSQVEGAKRLLKMSVLGRQVLTVIASPRLRAVADKTFSDGTNMRDLLLLLLATQPYFARLTTVGESPRASDPPLPSELFEHLEKIIDALAQNGLKGKHLEILRTGVAVTKGRSLYSIIRFAVRDSNTNQNQEEPQADADQADAEE